MMKGFLIVLRCGYTVWPVRLVKGGARRRDSNAERVRKWVESKVKGATLCKAYATLNMTCPVPRDAYEYTSFVTRVETIEFDHGRPTETE